MKEQTRSYAIRRVVSSLIGSELTDSELRDLSFMFDTDPEFRARIAEAIRAVCGHSPRGAANRYEDRWNEMTGDRVALVSEFMALVKKKRLSKRELTEFLHLSGPSVAVPDNPDRHSVSDLLSEFLIQATPSEIKRLMQFLRPDEPRDAYFEGLGNRP